MFKPPKMFHLKSNSDNIPPAPAQPLPETVTNSAETESQRVWSPVAIDIPQPVETVQENRTEIPFEKPIAAPVPTMSSVNVVENAEPIPETNVIPPVSEVGFADVVKNTESVAETAETETETSVLFEEKSEKEVSGKNDLNKEGQSGDDFSRYARPASLQHKEVLSSATVYPTDSFESIQEDIETVPELIDETENDSVIPVIEEEVSGSAYRKVLNEHNKVVRAPSLNSIPFADIWYTAEKIAYIRDKETPFALVPFETDDMEDFYKTLEQGYTGQSSYAIRFAGESYRVERIITLTGVQYNCRKMPGDVPDIYSLGLPKHTVDYLLTLGKESGLILFGGPTGMGKTTSASALMKKFLEIEGGFMYTIEDPPEMPLDGLYHAKNGGLGLCKQCPVDNERWGDGIKSALRSRPRYILVGEIRTPETASQVLRAATSGHLVLSTIHASTVEDALESLIKYASGAGLTESLAADLLARGILAVIHQKLEGSNVLRPVLTSVFANPHLTGGDQMRSLIRNNTINLQTLVESQSSRMMQGRPLFGSEKLD